MIRQFCFLLSMTVLMTWVLLCPGLASAQMIMACDGADRLDAGCTDPVVAKKLSTLNTLWEDIGPDLTGDEACERDRADRASPRRPSRADRLGAVSGNDGEPSKSYGTADRPKPQCESKITKRFAQQMRRCHTYAYEHMAECQIPLIDARIDVLQPLQKARNEDFDYQKGLAFRPKCMASTYDLQVALCDRPILSALLLKILAGRKELGAARIKTTTYPETYVFGTFAEIKEDCMVTKTNRFCNAQAFRELETEQIKYLGIVERTNTADEIRASALAFSCTIFYNGRDRIYRLSLTRDGAATLMEEGPSPELAFLYRGQATQQSDTNATFAFSSVEMLGSGTNGMMQVNAMAASTRAYGAAIADHRLTLSTGTPRRGTYTLVTSTRNS